MSYCDLSLIKMSCIELKKIFRFLSYMVGRWFCHVSKFFDLAKTILQGTVKGRRKRDRQKKRWEDNIRE